MASNVSSGGLFLQSVPLFHHRNVLWGFSTDVCLHRKLPICLGAGQPKREAFKAAAVRTLFLRQIPEDLEDLFAIWLTKYLLLSISIHLFDPWDFASFGLFVAKLPSSCESLGPKKVLG